METLADENTKRLREIAPTGRKAGMKGEIETDYKGVFTLAQKSEEREGVSQPEQTHMFRNDQEGA